MGILSFNDPNQLQYLKSKKFRISRGKLETQRRQHAQHMSVAVAYT